MYPLDAAETARPLDIRVLDDAGVNAMAYLGDQIFVLRGLLADILGDHPTRARRLEMARAGPDYPTTPVLEPRAWRAVRAVCAR